MAIIDVVKYDGGPNILAWKYPNSELGTWTQLIVNETQEAILCKDGQVLDCFRAGRHTLDTANIPILNKFINLPFGGKSPFSAEIWYINKVATLDIKWGTPTPIQLQDPKYNVFIPIRAFGQFGIKISDSKTFLTKLVGTLPTFTSDDVMKYFRGVYLTMVKDAISGYLVKKKVSIIEINANILDLSENLKVSVAPKLGEYGIELVNFYVNDISTPEDDSAVITLKEALAKKAEMDIIGYNYTQERSFDTLESVAANQGSGTAPFIGAGMGMAMGVGLGNSMGEVMGSMAQNLDTTPNTMCHNCNTEIPISSKFCPNCGKLPIINVEEVVCPKCSAINKVGSNFCFECATSLSILCTKCATPLESGDNFCPECGKKVGD